MKMREVCQGDLTARESGMELMNWHLGTNEYYQGIAGSYLSYLAEMFELSPRELEAKAEESC
jgi:hypothetical protein